MAARVFSSILKFLMSSKLLFSLFLLLPIPIIYLQLPEGTFFCCLAKRQIFLPFREKSAVCHKNCRFTKCHLEARLTNGREKLPFGREKLPFGRVNLPFRFGKRPPATLNLQNCRFAKKSAVSMENNVFNQKAEKCTRREAAGMLLLRFQFFKIIFLWFFFFVFSWCWYFCCVRCLAHDKILDSWFSRGFLGFPCFTWEFLVFCWKLKKPSKSCFFAGNPKKP